MKSFDAARKSYGTDEDLLFINLHATQCAEGQDYAKVFFLANTFVYAFCSLHIHIHYICL